MNLNLSWFDLPHSSGLATVVRCFLFQFVFRELHTRVVGWIDGVCVYVLVCLWAMLYSVYVLKCEFLCMHFSEWTARFFVFVYHLCASLHVCVYANCVFPCVSIWTACFSVYMYVRMCMWTVCSVLCVNRATLHVSLHVFIRELGFPLCVRSGCLSMCEWNVYSSTSLWYMCNCISTCVETAIACVYVGELYLCLYVCGCELSVLCLYLHSRYQILVKCLHQVWRFSLHPIDRKFVEN